MRAQSATTDTGLVFAKVFTGDDDRTVAVFRDPEAEQAPQGGPSVVGLMQLQGSHQVATVRISPPDFELKEGADPAIIPKARRAAMDLVMREFNETRAAQFLKDLDATIGKHLPGVSALMQIRETLANFGLNQRPEPVGRFIEHNGKTFLVIVAQEKSDGTDEEIPSLTIIHGAAKETVLCTTTSDRSALLRSGALGRLGVLLNKVGAKYDAIVDKPQPEPLPPPVATTSDSVPAGGAGDTPAPEAAPAPRGLKH